MRGAGEGYKSSNGKSRKVSKPQELRARAEIRQPIEIRWLHVDNCQSRS